MISFMSIFGKTISVFKDAFENSDENKKMALEYKFIDKHYL